MSYRAVGDLVDAVMTARVSHNVQVELTGAVDVMNTTNLDHQIAVALLATQFRMLRYTVAQEVYYWASTHGLDPKEEAHDSVISVDSGVVITGRIDTASAAITVYYGWSSLYGLAVLVRQDDPDRKATQKRILGGYLNAVAPL